MGGVLCGIDQEQCIRERMMDLVLRWHRVIVVVTRDGKDNL